MEVERYDNGVPSWVDLGSPDPDAAAAFYQGLFGWEYQEGPPEAGGYRLATLRGRAVAGLGPAQNPGPPVWATYVSVDDAKDAMAKVADGGGTVVVEPFDVMGQGHMGVFQDPQGAFLSVWQPGEMAGAGIVNEPGTYSWSELLTTNVDAAKSFYNKVFGWGADTAGEGPSAYTEWKIGDRSVGGMMAKPAEMPAEVPPHWAVYFTVEDADAAAAKATGLGGSLIMPPMDIQPGRFAVLADPTGAAFNVIALKPELQG
jgi:predicted enzyme related to lactoylglutathione lyase